GRGKGSRTARRGVSRGWLARPTAPITPQASQFGEVPVDYGLLWWIAPIDPAGSAADVSKRVIIAAGNMNQFLFVVPSLDLVVVNTGATNDSFRVTVDFVVRELIPALRNPCPRRPSGERDAMFIRAHGALISRSCSSRQDA